MIKNLRLVLITNRKICKQPLIDTIRLAIKGGVDTVQLREKELASNELFKIASDIKKITTALNVSLIINDRPDIMLAVDADGIHIGKRSMPIKEVRKIIGHDKLIGYSTHDIQEARDALNNGADYISYSPVFETGSKADYLKQEPVRRVQPQPIPVGPEAIKKVKDIVNIPIIALGGINENNIDKVLKNGAYGVAVVSNILQSSDPFLAAKNLIMKLKNHNRMEELTSGTTL
ncbi:MAG: thiamine phosphate synthase [Candidatus Anammoxibacter sp.]